MLDAGATDHPLEARRQLTAHFQASVEAGFAHWRTDEYGRTELHLNSGEVFRLHDTGVTRLR